MVANKINFDHKGPYIVFEVEYLWNCRVKKDEANSNPN